MCWDQRVSFNGAGERSQARLSEGDEEQWPIPARATSVLVRFLRGRGIKLPASRRVEIESVHDLGDEGGIACGLKRPGAEEAVIISLTHLRPEGGHPIAQDVRAYQIRRTAGLAREP